MRHQANQLTHHQDRSCKHCQGPGSNCIVFRCVSVCSTARHIDRANACFVCWRSIEESMLCVAHRTHVNHGRWLGAHYASMVDRHSVPTRPDIGTSCIRRQQVPIKPSVAIRILRSRRVCSLLVASYAYDEMLATIEQCWQRVGAECNQSLLPLNVL
jgi:hypothetical protein